MASLPTGSDELIYIHTDKVNLTIKGSAAHPSFQGVELQDDASELKMTSSNCL